VASSQGALVNQGTLKTTRELQKNLDNRQQPRENLKSFIVLVPTMFYLTSSSTSTKFKLFIHKYFEIGNLGQEDDLLPLLDLGQGDVLLR
jgi:hypothetical protein